MKYTDQAVWSFTDKWFFVYLIRKEQLCRVPFSVGSNLLIIDFILSLQIIINDHY